MGPLQKGQSRVCSAPCPGWDPAPHCSCTTQADFQMRNGELLGWRVSWRQWLVSVRYRPAILVLLVTQTRCLCHQKWNPLLATAGLNCGWDQTSVTVNHLLSVPLDCILNTCVILIIGCLFQTYTSALLVALGAEKRATRDNGSTVAFSLSGQIPELTSSAIMVHRSNHPDIRWWIIHDLAASIDGECSLRNLRTARLVCHHSPIRPVAYL